MPEVFKKKLVTVAKVKGTVGREQHFRRRRQLNKLAIFGLVAIAGIQVFVGLPVSLPLPIWGAITLAVVLFVVSLLLGFFAVTTIERTRIHKEQ